MSELTPEQQAESGFMWYEDLRFGAKGGFLCHAPTKYPLPPDDPTRIELELVEKGLRPLEQADVTVVPLSDESGLASPIEGKLTGISLFPPLLTVETKNGNHAVRFCDVRKDEQPPLTENQLCALGRIASRQLPPIITVEPLVELRVDRRYPL